MAIKQETIGSPPTDLHQPVNLAAYEAEKARRKALRDQRRPELLRCLDPEYAAQVEARKPLYEWQVTCAYTRPNAKGKPESISASHKIIAKNEDNAWAFFCDKIGAWPSRHTCDLRIDQLNKIN